MSEELKPCPFCGDGETIEIEYCEGTVLHPAYRVRCDNCGASTGYSDRGDHVDEWNNRAEAQKVEPVELCTKFSESNCWCKKCCPPQEGMVSVPVEPTDAMQIAGADCVSIDTTPINKLFICTRVYAAMLKAAQGEG